MGMTTKEAAQYLGVTSNHVSELCRKGKLEAQKEGHRWDIEFLSVRMYELGSDRLQPVLDYYQGLFILLHDELSRNGYKFKAIHPIRRRFWRLLQSGEYSPLEIRPLLLQYLNSLETEIANTIKKQSLAYWLHLYRRLFPGQIGSDPKPLSVGLVRAALEAAIQKYAPFEPCNRVGFTTEIPISSILDGFLMAPEFKNVREALEEKRQLVLTKFSLRELIEFYEVERLAYEIWRTSAMLRIVGKGAPILVVNDDEHYVVDARSEELNELISIYDDRLETGYVSGRGVVYSEYIGSYSGDGTILLPTYNVGGVSSEVYDDYFSEAFNLHLLYPIQFNFLWFPFNIRDYRNAHLPFADAFAEKHGVKLDAVLAVVTGLCFQVLLAWIDSPKTAILRYWQRAYEGPYLRKFVYGEVKDFMPVSMEILGIDENSLSSADIFNAILFWELDTTKQEEIDLAYSGPHFLFLPYGSDRLFIDFTWIDRRLYDMFVGIDAPDENFKGDALERVVQYGQNALPTGRLRSTDGEEKQIDASYDLGNRLVIVECKAVGRSIGFDRGNPESIRYRINLVDRMLQEIDDKANWLKEHPLGSNYDVRRYREILPLAVSPFVEYIPSLNPHYWLRDRLPRVLTPSELKTALENEALAEVKANVISIKGS